MQFNKTFFQTSVAANGSITPAQANVISGMGEHLIALYATIPNFTPAYGAILEAKLVEFYGLVNSGVITAWNGKPGSY